MGLMVHLLLASMLSHMANGSSERKADCVHIYRMHSYLRIRTPGHTNRKGVEQCKHELHCHLMATLYNFTF